jgi:hypothetical protein
MLDENGVRGLGVDKRLKARAYISECVLRMPAPGLPKHRMTVSGQDKKGCRLQTMDLVVFDHRETQKPIWGWVTHLGLDPNGNRRIEVTEIPPHLTPAQAEKETANPFTCQLVFFPIGGYSGGDDAEWPGVMTTNRARALAG